MMTETLTTEQHLTLEAWLDANGYGTCEAWAEDSGYVSHGEAESDAKHWMDADGNYVDLHVVVWHAYEAEQAALAAEREPLQYHYVVWAEVRDGKVEWHVDVEGDSLLFDGSVYDPNVGMAGDGWRTLDKSEEELDNRLFDELRRRLDFRH